MRKLLFLFLICLTLGAPLRADEGAIRSVITSQIEAFKADDFDLAFNFASPTIRQIFKTPENFGNMVKRGYPMVWRQSEVNFLSTEMIDGQLWQNVMIRDLEGGLHFLEYQMVHLKNGWKINAVRLRTIPDGSV